MAMVMVTVVVMVTVMVMWRQIAGGTKWPRVRSMVWEERTVSFLISQASHPCHPMHLSFPPKKIKPKESQTHFREKSCFFLKYINKQGCPCSCPTYVGVEVVLYFAIVCSTLLSQQLTEMNLKRSRLDVQACFSAMPYIVQGVSKSSVQQQCAKLSATLTIFHRK